MSDARLVAIFSKRVHGGPMDGQQAATLETAKGLVGSADYGGVRQITLVSQERWNELMTEVGATLGPQARRANLILAGIDLKNTRGRTLRVGKCLLSVAGETRPCEMMEEAATGLQAAMRADWGGGAWAEVVEGGPIAVGDTVAWQ